jgi:hypothetical protein
VRGGRRPLELRRPGEGDVSRTLKATAEVGIAARARGGAFGSG